jgi:hypothetical protein
VEKYQSEKDGKSQQEAENVFSNYYHDNMKLLPAQVMLLKHF